MKHTPIALAAALILAGSAAAKEGMWTPDQLSLIADDLKETGLELDPERLNELTDFPMGAVISLGGCTASFVSPEGLVVTNHHCARGSIQYNATAEENYLEEGFLAEDMEAELPAAPGTRVYVTVGVEDVTDRVRQGINADMSGNNVHDTIESRRKEIVAECEAQAGHRCQVSSFFGGAQYKLIDRLEIQDVRLVYGPADSIGKYGGDVDNWMWPRHTGDFAFYRAYVGPDGQPAEHSEDNVPYQPEHYLKVSAAGLDEGDFVMAAGYPGSTQRYARLPEVTHTFEWRYPTYIDTINGWIDTIEEAAPVGSDARIKYESLLAGLNNYVKNLGGQIEGARRVGLVERRRAREEALNAWIESEAPDQGYAETLEQLDELSAEMAQASKENRLYNDATRSSLLSAAEDLYRLSKERQKPDAEREPGYMERDMAFFEQRMQRLERRYDPAVDRAVWLFFLEQYVEADDSVRVEALDEALDLPETWNEQQVADTLLHPAGRGPLRPRNAARRRIGRPRRPHAAAAPGLHAGPHRLAGRPGLRRLPRRQLHPAHHLRHRHGRLAQGRPDLCAFHHPGRHPGKEHRRGPLQRPRAPARADPRKHPRPLGKGKPGLGAGQLPLRPGRHRRQLRLGHHERPRRTGRPAVRRHHRERQFRLGLRPPHHPLHPRRQPLHAVGDGQGRRRRPPDRGNGAGRVRPAILPTHAGGPPARMVDQVQSPTANSAIDFPRADEASAGCVEAEGRNPSVPSRPRLIGDDAAITLADFGYFE